MEGRRATCPHCLRADVPVSDKGALGNHSDHGGKRCLFVGMQVLPTLKTQPRAVKGVVQRNARRRKKEEQ